MLKRKANETQSNNKQGNNIKAEISEIGNKLNKWENT